MKRKCILVPAYNEEKNIAAVIAGIRNCCDIDIVVIDDGSTDSTTTIALKAGAYVIRHPFNLGYGVALQTGYKYAAQNGYSVLVQMDGDGQHKPAFIPALLEKMESDACDIVIGSRFLGDAPYKAGVLKAVGIDLFRHIIRAITGEKITDPTSGYQCINRRVFEFCSEDHFPYDYPDANVIIMLNRAGFKIKEIPVEMMPNPEERSMHSGILTISYYFFKMFLSIFITLIRKKQ